MSLSPLLLAAFTFAVGVMLLVSGATPATDEATRLLAAHVPLPLGRSVALPRQRRRLRACCSSRAACSCVSTRRGGSAVVIAAVSFVLAVPKGVALPEAAVLAFLLVVLLLWRRRFTRKARLLAEAFSQRMASRGRGGADRHRLGCCSSRTTISTTPMISGGASSSTRMRRARCGPSSASRCCSWCWRCTRYCARRRRRSPRPRLRNSIKRNASYARRLRRKPVLR